MKDKYLEKLPSKRKENLYSICFIVVCFTIMFLCDTEGTVKIFTWIALGIVALFSSLRGLIVSIPLGVRLLLIFINRD